MYNIAGKVALVTGGARGIGMAYCAALVKHGAKVIIVDTDVTNGKLTEKNLNSSTPGSSLFIYCDVTDPEALRATFDSAIPNFGKLDIVINNAGMVDETEEGWRKAVELNLVAVIGSCRLALKSLKPGGVIINTSSVAAGRESTFPVYSATKSGVTALSRSLGAPRPFEVTQIRVLAIQPGYTLTALTEDLINRRWTEVDLPENKFTDRLKNYPNQKPEIVAECMIDALKNGESGSVWTVKEGKWSHDQF